MARALFDPRFSGGPEAIVAVGAGLTMVVVHQGGLLQFVRTLDIGGDTVTQSNRRRSRPPDADAEAKTPTGGARPSTTTGRSATLGAVKNSSAGHNSIRFFSSSPGRLVPSRSRSPVVEPGLPASCEAATRSRAPVRPRPRSRWSTPAASRSAEEAAASTSDIGRSHRPRTARPCRPVVQSPSGESGQFAEKRAQTYLMVGGAAVLLLLIALSLWRIFAVSHAESQVTTSTSN